MQIILKMDPRQVYIIFAVVCISAPVLGVLFGGILIQRMGGYTDPKALDSCYYISILALLSGIFIPFLNNITLFVILIWLLLFFGGSIVPGLTGILINSASNKMKEVSNSITHLCYNLLGYLPSPVLYGLVCKYTGGSTSRYGLHLLMCWSILGVSFLYLSRISRNKIQTESKQIFEISKNYENITKHKRQLTIDSSLGALFGRISIGQHK
jgi:predicted MFS family arabinose efflux permease